MIKSLNKILPASCLSFLLACVLQEAQAISGGKKVEGEVVALKLAANPVPSSQYNAPSPTSAKMGEKESINSRLQMHGAGAVKKVGTTRAQAYARNTARSASGKDSLTLAISLYKAKKYQKAQDMFGRLSNKATSPTPLYYMALCQHELKRYHDSEHVMQHLANFFPGTQEGKLASQYLSRLPGAHRVEVDSSALALVKVILEQALGEGISRQEWLALPKSARIPITHEHGHLMVEARINGMPCKVAFDTGATACTISQFDFPGMFSASVLAAAPVRPMQRPDGLIECRETSAEVALPGLTRKVRVMVVDEPGVSVIGQNFFKEYSYQIDNFYIRLTKAPYSGDTLVAVRPAANKVADHVRQNQERFEIPFVSVQNIMLVDIEINGFRTKAIFDTGCATDGIVCHPNMLEKASLTYSSERGCRAGRLVVGPIIKMDVPVQAAAGLPFPLIGPKVFDRPYTVDQIEKKIKFDY